ncbi:MAG: hypothetical protein RJA34_2435 [Pseudomonadota bacterium]|jgi:hypothetical protein
MSKVLVVTYSLTGTSRRLARQLCSLQAWPMGEIREARPRKGVPGILRCLLDSWWKRTPEVAYTGPPPIAFDTVVLVSPIWAYRLAGPMRSFVCSRQKQLPDVAMISVMGGAGAQHAEAEVVELLGRPLILSTAFTQKEILAHACTDRLKAFASALETAQDLHTPSRAPIWKPQVV